MLTIRLKPMGRKKRTSYRIVVMEKRSKLEGKATDDLGYYDPFVTPHAFTIDDKKKDYWVQQGAHVSHGVQRLIEQFK